MTQSEVTKRYMKRNVRFKTIGHFIIEKDIYIQIRIMYNISTESLTIHDYIECEQYKSKQRVKYK